MTFLYSMGSKRTAFLCVLCLIWVVLGTIYLSRHNFDLRKYHKLNESKIERGTEPHSPSLCDTQCLKKAARNSTRQRNVSNCEQCQALLQDKPSRQLEEPGLKITSWWQAAAMILWFNVAPPEYTCKKIVNVGNWHACQDDQFAVRKPCLVYSFGIANDFSFDDAMGKMGCEVHSFDPSMKVGDHNRSKQVTFHAVGLSGIDSDSFQARQDIYVKGKQLWKIRTLKTIMKELGHENRVLDVLKIDVEGHEWSVVKNILDDGLFPRIRQFYLEWHLFKDWPAKDSYVDLYKLYLRLRDANMVSFRKSAHPYNLKLEKFNIQGDVNYINTNFNMDAYL